MKITKIILIAFQIFFFAQSYSAENALMQSNTITRSPVQPRLIVQIVIDQLRGDLLQQYRPVFSPDGFQYLFTHGVNYTNAHHPHALTVTCVGHATISTGSTPALHGIIANDWYDPIARKVTYCTEDQTTSLLANVRGKTEGAGQSPHNLLASTLSDEIVLAQKGRSFGVSLKDRAAITLAGHAGKAFWFDKQNGGFITSSYYYKKTPSWLDEWNKQYHPTATQWTLSSPLNTYFYAKAPHRLRPMPTYNSSFPHTFGSPNTSEYYKYMLLSPLADEVTAQFAIDLLNREKLGKNPQKTDYLGISFSALDMIGHQFGPNSLESEETLRKLDKTISRLLKTIDHQVGLKNTLIVLSADHGMTDTPAWLEANHLSVTPATNLETTKALIVQLLQKRYFLSEKAIETIKLPYIYLDHQYLQSKSLSAAEVAKYIANSLQNVPGFYGIYALANTTKSSDWLGKKINKMYFPGRSGDLYIVPNPYQDITETLELAITHGSPWNYDSYVPLLFVNGEWQPQTITRPVRTTDIATTLATLLNIKSPSSSIGKPLHEVIQKKH